MIKNKKIVMWIPAGRKRYLELLLSHIEKNLQFIDECHIWKNTRNQDDINYIESWRDKNPKIIVKDNSHDEVRGKVEFLRYIYPEYTESNTVYIKIDDDVVYIEPDKMKDYIEFRIDNPQYFLVYPMTINNPFCMWKLSRMGRIPHIPSHYDNWVNKIHQIKHNIRRKSEPRITEHFSQDEILCPNFWANPNNAYQFHSDFINNISDKQKYKIGIWELNNYETVSINCISWLGESFQEFGGQLESFEDETWLATFYPLYTNKMNCVYGDFIVSHYSYYIQMKHLDSTDLLQRYRELVWN